LAGPITGTDRTAGHTHRDRWCETLAGRCVHRRTRCRRITRP